MTEIEKIKEYHDLIMYKTTCECLDNDHDIVLSIEYDKEIEEVTLIAFTKMSWIDRISDNIFQRYIRRLKTILKLLFKGYIEIDSGFIFRNEEHIKELADVLIESSNKLKENRKNDLLRTQELYNKIEYEAMVKKVKNFPEYTMDRFLKDIKEKEDE